MDKISHTHFEWFGDDTFLVNFEPYIPKDNPHTTEEGIVEYHADEDIWMVEIQSYDEDGSFLEAVTLDQNHKDYNTYLAIAQSLYQENK